MSEKQVRALASLRASLSISVIGIDFETMWVYSSKTYVKGSLDTLKNLFDFSEVQRKNKIKKSLSTHFSTESIATYFYVFSSW